ncbi:MAG: hypothetical protein FWE63_01300 [Bacteroidales bacterium]|nr:hypothetical protein [Bacteroidales bacterium]
MKTTETRNASSAKLKQMLQGTTAIYTLKHNFKNIKEARKWAKKNIVGIYKNDITDEDIRVSSKAIDKYLSESAIKKSVSQCAHLSALIKIPELIKTAILKDIHDDTNQDKNIKEIQRLYGAIIYEGNIYPVKITIKVSQIEGSKAYSYEVMKIENPNGSCNHSG